MNRIVSVALVSVALGVSLTACSAADPVVQPTPQIIVQTPAPVVQPTPKIVQVTPSACVEALDAILDLSAVESKAMLAILDAYVDYPKENLADFGRRVEAVLSDLDIPRVPDNLADLITECRSYTSVSDHA